MPPNRVLSANIISSFLVFVPEEKYLKLSPSNFTHYVPLVLSFSFQKDLLCLFFAVSWQTFSSNTSLCFFQHKQWFPMWLFYQKCCRSPDRLDLKHFPCLKKPTENFVCSFFFLFLSSQSDSSDLGKSWIYFYHILSFTTLPSGVPSKFVCMLSKHPSIQASKWPFSGGSALFLWINVNSVPK